MSLNIIFLGDVVARPGRKAVADHLPSLRKTHKIDFVVANGENISGGFGVNTKNLKELYNSGVDVVTLGNHTWRKKEILEVIDSDNRLIRPYNYPPRTRGKGFRVFTLIDGQKIAVLSLLGRIFMEQGLDCPFQASRKLMRENILGEDYDALIVDIHAEATSEKRAIAHIWDGKASLVVGSHSHIPTADNMMLTGGTGFQTDAGMCGTYSSVIGSTYESSLAMFESKGRRIPLQPASSEGSLCGTYVQVNKQGLCDNIERFAIGGVLPQVIIKELGNG